MKTKAPTIIVAVAVVVAVLFYVAFQEQQDDSNCNGPAPDAARFDIERGVKINPRVAVGEDDLKSIRRRMSSGEVSTANPGGIPNPKEWGLLLSRLLNGDAEVRDKLESLATDPKFEITIRTTAIGMLGKDKDIRSWTVILDLLVDREAALRTSAFYSLPEGRRPPDFDYTAEPSTSSREQIQRFKNEIVK